MADSTTNNNTVSSSNDSDNFDSLPSCLSNENPPMLVEAVEPAHTTSWNFIAMLNIPGPDQFDHGDVTKALYKTGFIKDVSSVKLSQHSNLMTDQHSTSYATASVTTQNAITTSNASDVEIWSGFPPSKLLTVFNEECVASFNLNTHLLSHALLECIFRQASILKLSMKYNLTNGCRLEVNGSCSQVHKFREYLAALCIQQVLNSNELKPSMPMASNDVIESIVPNVTDPLSVPTNDDTAAMNAGSSNNNFANLSPDVLLLMSKVKPIRGIEYYPREGRIEVMATDPDERNKVISNFQESYQNIVGNRQLKTDVLELSASCKSQDITEMVGVFNEKYHHCYFSYDDISHSVKIISISSRQFEQAKVLLKEGALAKCPLPSSVSPPHDTDNVETLVLSDERVVTVKKGNMIKEVADVIVNAANSDLKHWGGLAKALDQASNGDLQKHSDIYAKKHGQIAPGEAVITKAGGQLKCQHVIHAVGPIAHECKSDLLCQELIFSAITNTLKKAHTLKATSIVLPALSTGVYAVDPTLSAKAVFKAITAFKYKKNTLKDIRIVILDEPTYRCFATELISWRNTCNNSDNKLQKLERSLSDQGTSGSFSAETGKRIPPGFSGTSVGTGTTQPGSDNVNLPNISYPSLSLSSSTLSTVSMSSASSHSGGNGMSGVVLKPPLLPPTNTLLLPNQFSKENKPDLSCPICLNTIATDPLVSPCCKNTFCHGCFYSALQYSPYCPTCRVAIRLVTGTQPPGTMNISTTKKNLPGYPHCGTIKIDYDIPKGIQGPEHPNPGQQYSGTSRTAYLPDNDEGRHVLNLLKRAFDARLIFTIGTSVTSGMTNTVTWNDIHHKTNIHGGSTNFGYPDSTYLKRVQEELKAKGIQ